MSSCKQRRKLHITKDRDFNIRVDHCNNIRKLYDETMEYTNRTPNKLYELKESDINSCMVNHIRHKYTNYKELLKRNKIYTSSPDVYHNYKNMVLCAIANEYPFLEEACNRQKRLVVMVTKVKPNKNFLHKGW